ncbi:hypothetical protein D3C85_1069770 [compost metagenome]
MRTRSHDRRETEALAEKGPGRFEHFALFRIQVRRGGITAFQCLGDLGRDGRGALDPVDVDAEQTSGSLTSHGVRNNGAPVATLGQVARVAEALHERIPGAGDALGVPAGAFRFVRKAEAGNRGQYEMKGVLGGSAMCRGVGQRTYDLQQFEYGTRPAMGHDEWPRVRMTGANVDEVDVQAVDIGQVLGECVEFRFGLSPVVAALPIAHQRLELVELHSLGTVGGRLPVRPAGCAEATAQIQQRCFRNLGAERAYGIGRRGLRRVGLGKCGDGAEHRERRQCRAFQHQCPAGQRGGVDQVQDGHGRASFPVQGAALAWRS